MRYDYDGYDYSSSYEDIDEIYEDDSSDEDNTEHTGSYWDSYYHNLADEIEDD